MPLLTKAIGCLTDLLRNGNLRKLVVITDSFTETFTSTKATTVDRLAAQVNEKALLMFAEYVCTKWKVKDAVVEVDFTKSMGELPFYVVWREGVFEDGIWLGGEWKGGIWKNGVWVNGIWYDGIWENGTWMNGTWYGGFWKGGKWENGVYRPSSKR